MRYQGAVGTAVLTAALVAVAACTIGAVALTTTPAQAAAPASDRFYTPPTPLPRGEPGDVIRTAPMAAPAGARAWKVLYHSRALDGRDVAVSGIVVAPDGPPPQGGRPIVSWAHGTTGLADECAPSKTATVATALPWEQELLGRGYVLAATDYEGLGTPGPHPYLVGESEGRGVLDVARAAHRLGGTHNLAGAGTRVVVVGHSQGGQAALFAGQIAPRYSPDLRVRGVVALAPATDPELVFAAAADPSIRAFAAMAVEGVRAAFPKTDVDAVLTPAAAAVMRSLTESGCITEAFRALTNVNLLRADANTVRSVRRALMRSAAGHVASRIPILVLQGDRDTTVPELSTRAYVARACALGDSLVYQRFPEATHGSIVAAGTPVLLQWLDDRVNGTGKGTGNDTAPPRSC